MFSVATVLQLIFFSEEIVSGAWKGHFHDVRVFWVVSRWLITGQSQKVHPQVRIYTLKFKT